MAMTLEPKGKLDAMTGYSFSTPVWDGSTWVTPAVAGVRVVAPRANGPEDEPSGWHAVDWRAAEGNVRRLRQRIFTASQAGDLKRVRSPQKLMLRSRSNTLVFSTGPAFHTASQAAMRAQS